MSKEFNFELFCEDESANVFHPELVEYVENLETKNAELESSLALLKEQYEECFMDYQKCGRERVILLDVLSGICNSQEVRPHGDIDRKLKEALEKIKE